MSKIAPIQFGLRQVNANYKVNVKFKQGGYEGYTKITDTLDDKVKAKMMALPSNFSALTFVATLPLQAFNLFGIALPGLSYGHALYKTLTKHKVWVMTATQQPLKKGGASTNRTIGIMTLAPTGIPHGTGIGYLTSAPWNQTNNSKAPHFKNITEGFLYTVMKEHRGDILFRPRNEQIQEQFDKILHNLAQHKTMFSWSIRGRRIPRLWVNNIQKAIEANYQNNTPKTDVLLKSSAYLASKANEPVSLKA